MEKVATVMAISTIQGADLYSGNVPVCNVTVQMESDQ